MLQRIKDRNFKDLCYFINKPPRWNEQVIIIIIIINLINLIIINILIILIHFFYRLVHMFLILVVVLQWHLLKIFN